MSWEADSMFPPARLDNFSTDSRQLRLYTWNVEIFSGVGKYSQFQDICSPCPKESTASRKPKLLTQMFLNGHMSIYIFPELLMIPMLEWVLLSRLSSLELQNCSTFIRNARPHRLALFTIYAPLTVQDRRLDLQRKHQFWENLHSIFNNCKSDFIPVLMGDFNTRLYHNQISGLEPHIGTAIFSSAIDDDLRPSTNLSFLTDLLQDNALSKSSPIWKFQNHLHCTQTQPQTPLPH